MRNEKEIIEGLIAGNEEAFRSLYDLHYEALSVYANHYVNDRFAAEAIVGDVIFSLWSNRSRLVITHSLRPYLMKAVRNRCINHYAFRRRLEDVRSEVRTKLENAAADYESDCDYPLSKLMEEELDLQIRESLDRLPILTRRVFELNRFADKSYREIAELTGISFDGVKYHMKSALLKLREDLGHHLRKP